MGKCSLHSYLQLGVDYSPQPSGPKEENGRVSELHVVKHATKSRPYTHRTGHPGGGGGEWARGKGADTGTALGVAEPQLAEVVPAEGIQPTLRVYRHCVGDATGDRADPLPLQRRDGKGVPGE